MKNPFKRKKTDEDTLNEEESPEAVEDENSESEEDTEDPQTIENLDVVGYWNRQLDKEETWLDDNGLMTTVFIRVGKKTIIELIARMEQSVINLRMSMVSTNESHDVFRKSTTEFAMWRARIPLRQYAKFLIGLRHSCIYEQGIGFHQPSYSEWDFDLENVDNEYARRLKAYHDKRKEIEIGEGWDKGLEK